MGRVDRMLVLAFAVSLGCTDSPRSTEAGVSEAWTPAADPVRPATEELDFKFDWTDVREVVLSGTAEWEQTVAGAVVGSLHAEYEFRFLVTAVSADAFEVRFSPLKLDSLTATDSMKLSFLRDVAFLEAGARFHVSSTGQFKGLVDPDAQVEATRNALKANPTGAADAQIIASLDLDSLERAIGGVWSGWVGQFLGATFKPDTVTTSAREIPKPFLEGGMVRGTAEVSIRGLLPCSKAAERECASFTTRVVLDGAEMADKTTRRLSQSTPPPTFRDWIEFVEERAVVEPATTRPYLLESLEKQDYEITVAEATSRAQVIKKTLVRFSYAAPAG